MSQGRRSGRSRGSDGTLKLATGVRMIRESGQALYAGAEIEEMHELSEAGLLDEFFVFVEENWIMAVLEQLQLPGVQRVLVPTVQFVLLYLLKVLFGGQSMNELPRWAV